MLQANPETVIVKDSKHGKGIFTTVDLPKNAVLFKITGKPITFIDTLTLGPDECFTLQIGMDRYIIPDAPFPLSNHSCEPNCGISRNMEFITLHDIKEGDELCWDYSTSMLERHWQLQCGCGSINCRHTIRDFDLLPHSLQQKYLKIKIVLPYINEKIFSLPTIQPV